MRISFKVPLLLLLFAIPQSIKPKKIYSTDWAHVTSTLVHNVVTPKNIMEVQQAIQNATQRGLKVAIKGAGYSQGGQTAYKHGMVIDMHHLNNIIQFDPVQKTITVQAGATWQQIQDYIDPYNLSLKVTQSYYNFSVGGSLSVNVHGRDTSDVQIIDTVQSLKLVCADGSCITANRSEHYDIFRAAIGGYGSIGIIIEATISLTDNCKLERHCHVLSISEYKDFFIKEIHNNPDIVIHNGNLYPYEFDQILSIAWHKTDKPLTIKDRTQPFGTFYPKELIGMQIYRRIKPLQKFRSQIEPKALLKECVAMRNYVMMENTAALQPLITFPTTHTLQEYFIPIAHFESFIAAMRTIINMHNVNILNCSIRFVRGSTESLLSYARQDCFAFVLYINILNTKEGKYQHQAWTQDLMDHALSYGGSFYLPYLLHARHDQFISAYPDVHELMRIKHLYDPNLVFLNELLRKYLPTS